MTEKARAEGGRTKVDVFSTVSDIYYMFLTLFAFAFDSASFYLHLSCITELKSNNSHRTQYLYKLSHAMPSITSISFKSALSWPPSSSFLTQLNAFILATLSTLTSLQPNVFQIGLPRKDSIFQQATIWCSLSPPVALPPFVTSFCSAFASDGKNYVILALSFFVVVLCYRLGSLARSMAPSQKQGSAQVAFPTTSLSQECGQQRMIIGGEDVGQMMQEYQKSAPELSYLTMTQVLRQLLLPMGSVWPREYYEAYHQAMRHGKMMSLRKSVVLRHIKMGLVIIEHSYVRTE